MARSLSALVVGLSLAVACSRTGDQLPIDTGEGAGGSTFAGPGPAVGSSTSGPASAVSSSSGGPGSSSAEASTGVTTSASVSASATSSGSGTPIDCLFCINSECPEVQACIFDPVCSQGLTCIFTDCGIDNPDFQCAIDCFGGDLAAALEAIQALGCVFTNCGDLCGGLIPQGA